MVEIELAAVQLAWRGDDYASAEAFAARVLELTRRAVAGADGVPALVAFPELAGMPLLFTAAGVEPGRLGGGAEGILAALARRDLRLWQRSAFRHRRLGLPAIYASYGVDAYRAYRDAFVAAARATDATIVAGTAFLPHVDEEPSLGLHVADADVRNVALVVGPSGVLGRVAKVHLTRGRERRIGLRRGREEDLHPIHTPVGAVGVAVCLDAFFDGVVGTLDGRGAQVVVQPSANDAAWDRPWPADPTRREGAVWLEDGLRGRIQGRRHVRYGVNPMLVGDLLGLRPRGRSSIVANVARTGLADEGEPSGVLAIAPDAETECVLRVRVPAPPPFGRC